MRRTYLLLWITILVIPSMAFGQELEADLSTHRIAITSSYLGEELVLFGIRELDGDVIVVLRGPEAEYTVRRKEKIAGLWLNNLAAEIQRVPGLYAVAASKELPMIADESFFHANQIGANHLQFKSREATIEGLEEFTAALIRDQERQGLYAHDIKPIVFVGERLFRAEFNVPPAAPVGTYTATTYLLKNKKLSMKNTALLEVTKTGVGRAVYDYSHQQPILYGVFAVILALIAGWVAAIIFRRV